MPQRAFEHIEATVVERIFEQRKKCRLRTKCFLSTPSASLQVSVLPVPWIRGHEVVTSSGARRVQQFAVGSMPLQHEMIPSALAVG